MNNEIPRHVAIIMDGNGRWAKKRLLPRVSGHEIGVESVREIVSTADQMGIKVLTFFTFSQENWLRPIAEINFLMELFVKALQKYLQDLHSKNIRIQFVGERASLSKSIINAMENAQNLTVNNTGLTMVMAFNYSGKWDITQAVNQILQKINTHQFSDNNITEEIINQHLSMAHLPDPDLLIRTSGEQRISNFLLWQLAYSELYFTNTPWPEFRTLEFKNAIMEYGKRQRRFGRTGEQLEQTNSA